MNALIFYCINFKYVSENKYITGNKQFFTWVYAICIRRVYWGKNGKATYNYVTEDVKVDQNNEAHYTSRKKSMQF